MDTDQKAHLGIYAVVIAVEVAAVLIGVAVVVIAIAGVETAVVVTVADIAEVIEQWQSEMIVIQIREPSLILKCLGALVMHF